MLHGSVPTYTNVAKRDKVFLLPPFGSCASAILNLHLVPESEPVPLLSTFKRPLQSQ